MIKGSFFWGGYEYEEYDVNEHFTNFMPILKVKLVLLTILFWNYRVSNKNRNILSTSNYKTPKNFRAFSASSSSNSLIFIEVVVAGVCTVVFSFLFLLSSLCPKYLLGSN